MTGRLPTTPRSARAVSITASVSPIASKKSTRHSMRSGFCRRTLAASASTRSRVRPTSGVQSSGVSPPSFLPRASTALMCFFMPCAPIIGRRRRAGSRPLRVRTALVAGTLLRRMLGEIRLQRLEAPRRVLGIADLLVPLLVGQLDRVDAVRDVREDARDVDAALADVEARLAQDADHLGAFGRDLGRGVAQVGEVEPLARQRVEVGRVVAGAVEVVHVDHQPRVAAVDRAQHVDRLRQVGHGGDRDVLEVHGQPERLGEVADLGELLDVELALAAPDARQHGLGAELGRDLHRRQVFRRVQAFVDAGELDVVDAHAGRGERRLRLLQHLRVVGQRVVGLAGQPHVDGADADVVVAGARRDVGHLRRRAAQHRQVGEGKFLLHSV